MCTECHKTRAFLMLPRKPTMWAEPKYKCWPSRLAWPPEQLWPGVWWWGREAGRHGAWQTLNLVSLEARRIKRTLKFALKSEKNVKFKFWFKLASKNVNTRSKKSKYCDVKANYTRFARSPLSFITKILNLHHKWEYVVIWPYVYSL